MCTCTAHQEPSFVLSIVLTRDKYKIKVMKIIICPNCKTKLKPNKFKKHLLKVHPQLSEKEIESLLPPSDSLTSALVSIPLSRSESELLRTEKNRIYTKFISFEIRFRTFLKAHYFDSIELDFNRLKEDVNDFSEISENELNLPMDVMFAVLDYKFLKRKVLFEKMDVLKKTTPTKSVTIEEHYQTIYVTWSDLSFDKNKIRISANRAFVNAIEIPRHLMTSDNLNINFYRELYPDSKFKLTAYKGVIIPHRSRGLDQIFDQIAEHSIIRTRSKQKRKV